MICSQLHGFPFRHCVSHGIRFRTVSLYPQTLASLATSSCCTPKRVACVARPSGRASLGQEACAHRFNHQNSYKRGCTIAPVEVLSKDSLRRMSATTTFRLLRAPGAEQAAAKREAVTCSNIRNVGGAKNLNIPGVSRW